MKIRFQLFNRRHRLVAGLGAVMFVTAAMAGVLAWAPAPAENLIEVFVPERASAGKARCAECGVIIARREIEEPRDDALLKASLNPSRRYEITVRMRDGSSRVIADASPANWRAGERVTLIDGVDRPIR